MTKGCKISSELTTPKTVILIRQYRETKKQKKTWNMFIDVLKKSHNINKCQTNKNNGKIKNNKYNSNVIFNLI